MNQQEIFTKVQQHLRKQGVASVKQGVCKYRGPKGTSCAVGCLIPDSLYDSEIEGLNVNSMYLGAILDFSGLKEHKPLLTDLQKAHDKGLTESIDTWESEMLFIANKFNLEY